VTWNRRYGGPERELDAGLKQALRDDGSLSRASRRTCCSNPGRSAPGRAPRSRCSRRSGAPAGRTRAAASAAGTQGRERDHPADAASDDLDDWDLLPTHPDWAGGLRDAWTPGADAAHARLRDFLDDDLGDYAEGRDVRRKRSPRGSPRTCVGRAEPVRGVARGARTAAGGTGASRFLTELGWREFAWHVLFHAPDLATRNWRAEFDAFPWPRLHPTALRAWEEGRTGVPLVDAGNAGTLGDRHDAQSRAHGDRVVPHEEPAHRLAPRRAVVLGHPRRRRRGLEPVQLAVGRRFGRGCRAVLPRLQPRAAGDEVRPDGEYVRRWVPEAGTDEYPEPIVDLTETRTAALAAYERVKAARA
jgi:deoxyribodipyrimidine photo-lyase